jgi:hypothetical protein
MNAGSQTENKRMMYTLCLPVIVLTAQVTTTSIAEKTPKEALQAFNDLIGSWRATGEPAGSREEKQRGFWTEKLSWEWQFRGDDVWLKVAADKGKYFQRGELRYLPAKDQFQLTVVGADTQKQVFTGTLKDSTLTLDRIDEKTGESQRLVVKLLHSNRYVYDFEVKAKDRSRFVKRYQVGATKEGEPFAATGAVKPECVVSGGLGTIRVTHKGETYYVCCSGCQTAFNEDPEKFIKEFKAKKKEK